METEDLKEPIVFKTAEIWVKVHNYLNDLECADILYTCEFLGYLEGAHEAGGINRRGYEFYHTLAMSRFNRLMKENAGIEKQEELVFNQPEGEE